MTIPSPKAPPPPQAVSSLVRRVLVVDDEPTIRTAVSRYLRRRGWQVDEAEDGRAGLTRLQRSGVDSYKVVLSDLRMPHYTGEQLHDWLAEHRPDIFGRLILMTGDLASPGLTEFLARTPRPVIEKPYELAVLLQLVEAVAHGR